MSFQIDEEASSLGDSIRHLAGEEIRVAIAASKLVGNGKNSPVHQTRKHLRKARAALGLLAPEVSRRHFQNTDRRLRNITRLISDIHDAEMGLQTVKQLRKGSDVPHSASFAETEELLAFELDSFLAAFAGWEAEAAAKLRHAYHSMEQWHVRKLTSKQICRAVRHTYRAGRRALKRAEKKRSPKSFYVLRKRAEDLWYQIRLLRPLQPAVLTEMSRDLEILGEHLSHAHDLCFVTERLKFVARGRGRRRGRQALEALIETREEDLLNTSCALGKRLYALKPDQFASQISRYFDEFRRTKSSGESQVAASRAA